MVRVGRVNFLAKLYFKYGCMGSSKSMDLIRTAFNYRERGQNPVVMTSAVDTRVESGTIASRMGFNESAVAITMNMNIYDYIKNLIANENKAVDVILVDEVNFLTREQIWELSDIVDKLDIAVIAFGLRSDFRGQLFPGTEQLMAIADKIEEIKAMCHCGKKATINARIRSGKVIYEGNQIEVGFGYIALCRKCWKEGKLECSI
jgi:thymidine kinase